MKIGSVEIEKTSVLAPLAGITHLPFRFLVKTMGCGLVCSEMVSAYGLVHGSPKTRQMLAIHPEERPISIQLFGSDPDIMAIAAKMVEATGADILDLNFGCSVKKILKSGSGSALMKDSQKAKAICRSVRKSIQIPLTIKIRSGWEPDGVQALEIVQIAQDEGVDAVAIHPRTARQGFSGRADWSVIQRAKALASIPIIGNGDIVEPADALKMKHQTGCDGVMIGRAVISNPWICSQTDAMLAGGRVSEVTNEMRFDAMRLYMGSAMKYFGEKSASFMMRSRLGWLVKGLPHASHFREAVKRISSEAEALEKIDAYQKRLKTDQKLSEFPKKKCEPDSCHKSQIPINTKPATQVMDAGSGF